MKIKFKTVIWLAIPPVMVSNALYTKFELLSKRIFFVHFYVFIIRFIVFLLKLDVYSIFCDTNLMINYQRGDSGPH
jgi:hypothetical protein